MLKVLTIGLMLACGSAYASVSASAAPVAVATNAVSQANPVPHIRVSNVVDDSITNWVIAIFGIIIGMFIVLIALDARRSRRE